MLEFIRDISPIVLTILTGIYVYLTYKISKETRKSYEMSFQPELFMDIRKGQDSVGKTIWKFIIINGGEGSAKNIEITHCTVPYVICTEISFLRKEQEMLLTTLYGADADNLSEKPFDKWNYYLIVNYEDRFGAKQEGIKIVMQSSSIPDELPVWAKTP